MQIHIYVYYFHSNLFFSYMCQNNPRLLFTYDGALIIKSSRGLLAKINHKKTGKKKVMTLTKMGKKYVNEIYYLYNPANRTESKSCHNPTDSFVEVRSVSLYMSKHHF